LIGSWFGGPKTEATPEKEQAVVRGANTDPAAKPKQTAPVRAASSATPPAASAAAKPRGTAPKPTEVIVRAPKPPAPTQQVQTATAEPPQQSEIRTAYTTPPPSNNGLLVGAQPVVPVGSFNTFR
jgi:hypothetical protein